MTSTDTAIAIAAIEPVWQVPDEGYRYQCYVWHGEAETLNDRHHRVDPSVAVPPVTVTGWQGKPNELLAETTLTRAGAVDWIRRLQQSYADHRPEPISLATIESRMTIYRSRLRAGNPAELSWRLTGGYALVAAVIPQLREPSRASG